MLSYASAFYQDVGVRASFRCSRFQSRHWSLGWAQCGRYEAYALQSSNVQSKYCIVGFPQGDRQGTNLVFFPLHRAMITTTELLEDKLRSVTGDKITRLAHKRAGRTEPMSSSAQGTRSASEIPFSTPA
jgi:hypothetical protein